MNTLLETSILPLRLDLSTVSVAPEADEAPTEETSASSLATKPLRAFQSTSTESQARPAEEASGPLALIIEDDADLATIFAESLRASGFTPEVIYDGQLGVERLKTVTPHLVVLDLHLPHVSGVKILKDIRGDARLKNTRVVVVTADPRMADDVRSLSDIALIKPVSFSLMRELTSRFRGFAPRDSLGG